jgi:hypothetical protein
VVRRRLITRTELSRLAGVAPPSITKAARTKLRPACVRDRIDLDHPLVVAYLKRHGAEVPPRPPSTGPRSPRRTADARPGSPDSTAQPAAPAPAVSPAEGDSAEPPRLPVGIEGVDAEAFGRMTLDQIAREYSTMDEFERVLDAAKTLAIIREKDDKHRQFEGSVVTRELIDIAVFGALERLSRRLAKPVPKTVVRRAITDSKGGKPTEEIEGMACDLMGTELKLAWDAIAKALKKL